MALSMIAAVSGSNAFAPEPKIGGMSPNPPPCIRGSGVSFFAIMTKTRPVIGPACADAGNDTSNFSPADCGAGAACTLAASEKIVADKSPTKCLLTTNLMPLLPWRRERTTFITGTSRMKLGIRKAVDSFFGRCSHDRTRESVRGADLKAHGRSLHFGSEQELANAVPVGSSLGRNRHSANGAHLRRPACPSHGKWRPTGCAARTSLMLSITKSS